VSLREDTEDDEDETNSNCSRSRLSSVASSQDAEHPHQHWKARQYGAPTAQMLPGQHSNLVSGTQANDTLSRRSLSSVSSFLSEAPSDVDLSDRNQEQSGRSVQNASKHIRPTDGEVEQPPKRRKRSQEVFSRGRLSLRNSS
jgi:hypothetical protein